MADYPPYLPGHLTSQQREAIVHQDSPLLIIAGPGSGKTEVISWRAAHLILSDQARPKNLLVTTFTHKAALELKDRIQQKLPDVNVELMQVSTIHSFCTMLLREYESASPIGGAFTVLDESGQFLFVFAHRKELGLSEIVKGRAYHFYREVAGTFNLATEEMIEPDKLEAFCARQLSSVAKDETDLWREWATVAQAYHTYCDLLRENQLADFAWLQRYALEVLQKHPDALGEVRGRFTHVLIDEYQDTNALQEKIMKLITTSDGQGLTVVGDDDQALYRFRGATVKNILEFKDRYSNVRVIYLTQNFRSRKQIVDHSLQVIVKNPARFEKELFTVRGTGSDVLLLYEHNVAGETQAVVDLLCQLRRQGAIQRWGDVAVLLRSVRSYAEPYLDVLTAAGVPYHVIGQATFFEREEIQGMWQLISFLGASKAWGDRFVRHPIVGLSEETVKALKRIKTDLREFESPQALQAVGMTDADDLSRLWSLIELKRRVQGRKYNTLLEIFYRLLSITGLFARYERAGHAEPLHNLGMFSQLVANYDAYGQTRNFYQFMAYLKLLKQGGLDPITEPPEDAVQVMTIHQAKGLEFPVVVLGAAMEGRIPSRSRAARYKIPYHMRASGMPEVDDPHIVDERRLFYVAATRARELLIIGTADVVNKRGGGPSRFLYEMFGKDLRAVADVSAAHIETLLESQDRDTGEPHHRHSYSQLAYYLQCPLRFKYAEIYGVKTPAPAPHNFGANVHRALHRIHQQILAGRFVDPEEVPAIVESVWTPQPGGDPKEEAVLRQRASDQIKKYLQQYGHERHRVAAAEEHFAFSIAKHVLTGRIDLMRNVAGGGIEIVDFKTGQSSPIVAEQIDVQLALYALGAGEDLAQDVRHRTVHFLGDNVTQTWDWSAEDEQHTRKLLVDMLDKIAAREFRPRISYCSRCDEFRALCPFAV